jgi:hypothetical protein
MLCVGNLCDWELQVSVLYSQTSDLACLRNFNLSVRSSLLSFLLTSLSYSCGLAPLAAVACPSTLLPLIYSFLTLALLYPVPRSDVHLNARRHSLHGALQNLLIRSAGHRTEYH